MGLSCLVDFGLIWFGQWKYQQKIEWWEESEIDSYFPGSFLQRHKVTVATFHYSGNGSSRVAFSYC